MYRFKCPSCGRKCKLNKKLSDLRNREESKRIYHWECAGQRPDAPHPPSIFKVENLSIMTDAAGRITTKTDKVTRLWIEDSNVQELLDEWKGFMSEERYKRLPKDEQPIPAG